MPLTPWLWQRAPPLSYHPAAHVRTMAYDPDASEQPTQETGGEASDDRTTSMIGCTIGGNFKITSLIGAGAMGDVYQAQQLSLGKEVAVKLLRRELLVDETLRRRFELEAKNASSLNHPNCIQIIDFGREADLLFIAMEYLNGNDLSRTIEHEWPLPLERTIHIFDQVLAALEEAHDHGIVHRDLKPANIMLVSRRGDPDFVKVCDFGIAKSEGTQAWGEGLTMKGLICGTPEYMSPEQARGEKIDGRSDLYAAGVVLYQMLTREVPFRSTSPVALLSMHLSEPPEPPSTRNPGLDVPEKLEALVMRALEKEANRRPQTAAEFRHELREAVADLLPYVSSMGTAARASGQRLTSPRPPSASSGVVVPLDRRRPWAVWLMSAGLLAAGAAVAVPLVRRSATTSSSVPRHTVAFAPAADETAVGSGVIEAPAAPLVPANAEVKASSSDLDQAKPPAVRHQRAEGGGRRGEKPHAENKGLPVNGHPVAPPVVRDLPAELAPAATQGSSIGNSVVAPAAGGAMDGAEAVLAEAQKLLNKGLYTQACEKGEEAGRLQPSLPSAHKFLGRCYMRAGKTERANEHFLRYLELAPSASDAAFIRSIVK